MPWHHTKTKGDLAVAHAQLALAEAGFMVCLPLTEHAPFDLVAYRDHAFVRVQVKYRESRDGRVQVALKSTWADRNGTHTKRVSKDDIDLLCIYCPDTGDCYWIDPASVDRSVTLRTHPARNGQVAGVRLATDFTEVPTARGWP